MKTDLLAELLVLVCSNYDDIYQLKNLTTAIKFKSSFVSISPFVVDGVDVAIADAVDHTE